MTTATICQHDQSSNVANN